MILFSFSYQGYEFVLRVSHSVQEEELLVNGAIVSHQTITGITSQHLFTLDRGNMELHFAQHVNEGYVHYELLQDDQILVSDRSALPNLSVLDANVSVLPSSATQTAENAGGGINNPVQTERTSRKSNHTIALIGAAFKIFKSIKVFKVTLVAASVSVYSVMFTVEFAVALVAILIFHEYGHLRAMKKFGIPTKGMYLIPFVGGLAVGDKPTSRWQDVYISLMGPIYGLLMTLVFYILYLITGGHFVGLVASTSALINVFNLLPVYPLDGGRVVKSLVFSGRKYSALVFLLVISAVCLVGAYKLGFALIGFFIILGVIDIVSEWRTSLQDDITPLTRYGVVFCLGWYLATLAAFLLIMVMIAKSELPGSEIMMAVLNA